LAVAWKLGLRRRMREARPAHLTQVARPAGDVGQLAAHINEGGAETAAEVDATTKPLPLMAKAFLRDCRYREGTSAPPAMEGRLDS
jgi:hypothetical protein